MSSWYNKTKNNLSELINCITFFELELDKARLECGMKGNLEKLSREMPGIVEYRFNQLQEIEAILEHLNIELRKLRSAVFRKFTEHYNKALSSRDAEKYIDKARVNLVSKTTNEKNQNILELDCGASIIIKQLNLKIWKKHLFQERIGSPILWLLHNGYLLLLYWDSFYLFFSKSFERVISKGNFTSKSFIIPSSLFHH